jgi:dihydrolipoamide dehydrogenase
MQKFDVAVIGGGPGGYVCAIRCAQLGLRAVCIDNWVDGKGKASLGGTCLNVGCIPSKAMLDSSHHYYHLKHDIAQHGIHVGNIELDLDVMQQRRAEIVKSLTGGVEMLFAKHKVTWIKGLGRLVTGRSLEVVKHDQSVEVIGADHIVIATGSTPQSVDGVAVDHDRIIDSTDALEQKDVPPRLAVLGAGAVGLELGSVWSRLGSKVTVLQRRDKFLPNVDRHIAEEAYLMFQLQGLDIRLGAQLVSVKATPKQVTVTFADARGESRLLVDRVLVATGRKPNTSGLNAEAAGLKMDGRGRIEVDAHCHTNLKNVWAIGDVVRGPMLAHKASEEGVMVAERIAGQHSEVNYEVIPFVIYTWPEIAWAGKSPEELTAAGVPHRVGAFPFKANGRARALGATGGSVRIVADEASDRVLGVHILGPNASEMIAQAVTAMEFGASSEDLARTIHAHPTLAEAFHEAALAVDRRTIHI